MTRHSAIALTAVALFACSKQTESGGEAYQSIVTVGAVAPAPAAPPVVAQDMGPARRLEAANTTADAIGFAASAPARDDKVAASPTPHDVSPSMIIRTGSASVEIQSLDPAVAKIRQLASQLGGYVANSSFSGGRDQVKTAMIELKIPSEKYEQAVSGLNGLGKLESINTAAEDVGEEYVDVAARVANSKRLEERLVALLATRAGKLSDVLSVERELARVREEIERYEGRMRYLKTRSSISTLSVTLHEPFPILGKTPGENPLAVAVRQAWRNFVGLVAGFIASLGILIPVFVIAAGGWAVYRKFGRRSMSLKA